MKAYESYKDSGVEWLGQVPSHWEVNRFRNFFTFGKGLNITKENLQDEGIPCVNYGEIHSKYGFDVIPERDLLKCVDSKYLKSDSSLLRNGDFVFADTSEDIDGSGNFTYLNSETRIFAGYHTVITRLKITAIHRYIAYYFDSLSFRNQIRKRVKGVKVFSITQAILKDTFVIFPTLEEQQKIAQYLDDKTAKIDQAITLAKKQIDLLKEHKQILIQQVVTKGLNPNAPLKDSGVEWLGKVPSHWGVKKLKYLVKLTPRKSEIEHNLDELCSFIPMEKIKLDSLVLDEEKTIKDVYSLYTYFKEGDLLIAKVTPCFENKNFAIAQNLTNGIGFGSSEIYVLRTNQNISNRFLFYRLQENTFMDIAVSKMTGTAGLKRVPSEFLNNFQIAVPPLPEQQKIAQYLDEQTAKIDRAIALKNKHIEKLKEYKSVLISDVVTGKVWV